MNTVSITTLGDAHDSGPNTHIWLSAGQTMTINRDDTARHRDVLRVRVHDGEGNRFCVVYNVVNVVADHVNVTMDIEYGGTITLNDVDVSVGVDETGYPMVGISRDDILGLDVTDVTAFRVVMRQRDGG